MEELRRGLIGVLLVASAAHADPRVALEAGAVGAKATGSFSSGSPSVGWYIGADVVLDVGFGVFLRYRRLPIDDVVPGDSGTVNDHSLSFHHADITGGFRYARPVLPHLTVFGELQLTYAILTESDVDFAGGDDISNGGFGFGLRAGVLVPIDECCAVGAALGYSSVDISISPSTETDAWVTADLFVRAGF